MLRMHRASMFWGTSGTEGEERVTEDGLRFDCQKVEGKGWRK